MFKWFSKLDLKKKKWISTSLVLIGTIFIIIGIPTKCFYLIFLGLPFLVIGVFLVDKTQKDAKQANEDARSSADLQLAFDKNQAYLYRKLKKNDFELSNARCNFECSLRESNLKQLIRNKFFSQSDFSFDVKQRILEFNEKGKSLFLKSKTRSFVALDIETTGLSKTNDRIIQIAMVKVIDGQIQDTYCKLVNPKKHIASEASEVNGIYDEDVENEKKIIELFPEIFDFINNLTIVAHNAAFDMGFLRNEWYRCFDSNFPKHKDICTMQLWRLLYSTFEQENPSSAKLSHLVHTLLDDEDINKYDEDMHDALCDATMTAKVFMKTYDDNYRKLLE
ncbi:MAG: 3'-5' exonuclease [Clostridiales bacterium]|nr:3'-5' exonuclease [Clostridiales bacterium]